MQWNRIKPMIAVAILVSATSALPADVALDYDFFKICIGNLNHLFFWPEQYRRTGELSIPFLFDENPGVTFGWLGQRSGRRGAKCSRSSRSLELRASGSVGLRW